MFLILNKNKYTLKLKKKNYVLKQIVNWLLNLPF